jgi:hypothetical protein
MAISSAQPSAELAAAVARTGSARADGRTLKSWDGCVSAPIGGLEAIASNITPETQQRSIENAAQAAPMQSVSEPSLSEEMGGDKVPF